MADSLRPDYCAEMLKALGEPLRLRIIDTLRTGPLNVKEICARLAVEPVTASHHLKILRNAGLLHREKRGRFVVYRLREGVLSSGQIDLGCCQLKLPG